MGVGEGSCVHVFLHLTRGQRRSLDRIHTDCEHCKLSSVAKHYTRIDFCSLLFLLLIICEML